MAYFYLDDSKHPEHGLTPMTARRTIHCLQAIFPGVHVRRGCLDCDGLADIALASDTGGSLRIPAAFCGLVGFKPTQSSLQMAGAMPLSDSLDSVGPMARDVMTCANAWHDMAGRPVSDLPQQRPEMVVPLNLGLTDLDPAVVAGFAKPRNALTIAG